MIRDITIGQYYPSDSILHRLDPRVKTVGVFIYIICLFLDKNFVLYVGATAFLFIMIKLSRVPIKYILKGLKPIFMLLLFSVIINMFFTNGKVIFELGFLKVTDKGLKMAVYMAIRLVYLIMASSLLTLTTTPTKLADALEKMMAPLNKIKIPVHDIAMMISIALRFIPILTEELDKIMKAQSARCADFESGSLMHKLKSLVPILVPLFVSAIRRANDLAIAMEARCYVGGEGRTKMKPLIYQKIDYIAYLILLGFIMIVICALAV